MSRISIVALESDVRAFTLEIEDWPPDRQGFTHYALLWEGWRHDLGGKGPRAQHFHAPVVERIREMLKAGYHVAVNPTHPRADTARKIVEEAKR